MLKQFSVFKCEPNTDFEQPAYPWEPLMVLPHKLEAFFDSAPPREPEHGAISAWGIEKPTNEMLEQLQQLLPLGSFQFLPLTLVVRERVIDSSAVSYELAKRIKKISDSEGRTVGRKEKQEIIDEIVFEMLPKAPIREKKTPGYVTSDGHIVVGATGKAAEDYLGRLRQVFGTLPTSPFLSLEARARIKDFSFMALMHKYFPVGSSYGDRYIFNPTGSFAFEFDKEIVDIRNGQNAVTDDLLDVLQNGDLRWIELTDDEDEPKVIFKLTRDFHFKSVKTAIEFEPEQGEDQSGAEYSLARQRFYLWFFLKMATDLQADIIGDADRVGVAEGYDE